MALFSNHMAKTMFFTLLAIDVVFIGCHLIVSALLQTSESRFFDIA